MKDIMQFAYTILCPYNLCGVSDGGTLTYRERKM